GAHWGGGLWISAVDLARLGQLCLRGGPVSTRWIAHQWRPSPVKPAYGLSWWLNDQRHRLADGPTTGRCARGDGGAHLLWLDPARDLVVSSRWGTHVESLLAEVSAAIEPSAG
ncbi:MAG TPA: serine hydrolase, partial [Actinophytocola sp.]|nr:serine hydrolase [Actinophytocola sp.]